MGSLAAPSPTVEHADSLDDRNPEVKDVSTRSRSLTFVSAMGRLPREQQRNQMIRAL